jgi:hypothetical protein
MTDHKTIREALEFYADRQGIIHTDAGKLVGNCAAPAKKALAALDRIEAKHTAHEDYTDDVDVFKYIREKQGLGHFTHPAIVNLFDMAKAQTDDAVCNHVCPQCGVTDSAQRPHKTANHYGGLHGDWSVKCCACGYNVKDPNKPAAVKKWNTNLREVSLSLAIRAATKPAAQTVPQEVVDALEWYANKSNWDDDVGYKPRLEDRAIGSDQGRRASEALALLTDGKENL